MDMSQAKLIPYLGATSDLILTRQNSFVVCVTIIDDCFVNVLSYGDKIISKVSELNCSLFDYSNATKTIV